MLIFGEKNSRQTLRATSGVNELYARKGGAFLPFGNVEPIAPRYFRPS